jgi:hypothetical protein
LTSWTNNGYSRMTQLCGVSQKIFCASRNCFLHFIFPKFRVKFLRSPCGACYSEGLCAIKSQCNSSEFSTEPCADAFKKTICIHLKPALHNPTFGTTVVFKVVTPCRSERARRYGGRCRLHLQGRRVSEGREQQKYKPRGTRVENPAWYRLVDWESDSWRVAIVC